MSPEVMKDLQKALLVKCSRYRKYVDLSYFMCSYRAFGSYLNTLTAELASDRTTKDVYIDRKGGFSLVYILYASLKTKH